MIRPVALLVALAAFSLGSLQASATTLTFDSAPSVGYNNFAGYEEQGYRFDMTLGAGGFNAHVGDATYLPGTLNWHEGGDNGYGNYMTLTRVGGGMFSLLGLHVDSFVILDAGSYHAQLSTGDYSSLNVNDVSSVTFSGGYGTGYYSGIDNVVLQASVPEIDPAGMGSVLALVTGALGVLERRRLKAA